jgi:CRP/FNR family transcriptional regulator, cyclic AMP receptor protein
MSAAPRPKPFDVQAFLETAGLSRHVRSFRKGERIFAQGDPADTVLYIQRGSVKLSVLSRKGKEAVIAVLGAGDFLGESALAGGPLRLGNATALEPSDLLFIDRQAMVRLLHEQQAMSDRFIAYMVARNMRVEADLVDQLFNSSEKRLARTLLLLARYGRDAQTDRVLPAMSQDVLAAMVGTTRSRINFFLNKFRKLGFITYEAGVESRGIRVNPTLMTVLLHD